VKYGPDLAQWQDQVDLDLLAADADFVILKAGDTIRGVDPRFIERRDGLAARGVPFGAYWRVRDLANLDVQAIRLAGLSRGARLLALDFEDVGTFTDADRFLAVLAEEARPHQRLAFYTYWSFWTQHLGDPATLPGPPETLLWFARWDAAGPYATVSRPSAFPDPPPIWQASNGIGGQVRRFAGVADRHDVNVMPDTVFEEVFVPNPWYPRAIRKELVPESTSEPKRIPRQYILHSIVGGPEGALRMFRCCSDLESTFILPKQGPPWQLLPVDREADANFHANHDAVSVETEDNGHPDTDPWTASQIRELILLGFWLKDEWGVPTDNILKHGECTVAGTGYHSLHHTVGADGVWSAHCWTNVRGKTCPGLIRIHQFESTIAPALAAGALPEEEFMALFDTREQFIAAVKEGALAAQNEATIFGQPDWRETVRDVIVAKLNEIDTQTNTLAAQLEALLVSQGNDEVVLSVEQLAAITAELRATAADPAAVVDLLRDRLTA